MSDAEAREGQHPVSTSRSAPLGSTGGGIKSTLRAISGIEGFGVVAAMLGLCLFLTLTTDTFMTQNNLVSVLRQSSYIGIMAVGMVFVISMGDIDLSVGALLMFTSVTMSVMFREGYHPALIIPAGILLATVCGLVNGILAVALRIPTIIITLGTLQHLPWPRSVRVRRLACVRIRPNSLVFQRHGLAFPRYLDERLGHVRRRHLRLVPV